MQLVESEHCLGLQVRGKYNEREELKRQEECHQQRISRAKEELIAAEVELANLPSYERPKDELVALAGTSYSFLQSKSHRDKRNGAKLFAVGTDASLVGTGITNALINARRAIDKTFAGEAEDVPILSTSVAYGVYLAVSSNLRDRSSGWYIDLLVNPSVNAKWCTLCPTKIM
ncbi:uncharacterized protein LOC130792694 [Actinidia eriantha]|uniref:uncharacterized protein LOC130792694 n=1 Tax=Actinidia eriantha TaxID=165200 RepID=UPI00258DDFC8|nr:uncharacterized protein LOC130792694 [Actinidia eriantha]